MRGASAWVAFFCLVSIATAFQPVRRRPLSIKVYAQYDVKVITDSGETTIKVSDSENILDAFERYTSLEPQYACRSGIHTPDELQ